MMEHEFEDIVSLYGRDVTVYNAQTPGGMKVRAFVQPMRERGTEQSVPSPLGQVKQDRFLYLGPACAALEETSRVKVQNEVYRVDAAQPVRVGETVLYRWAVLSHWEKEDV